MNALIEPDIRPGGLLFEDRVNFQWGILRSGVFSIPQHQMLQKFGETLKSLEMGLIQPETNTEERFVAFCLGMHEAETELEHLWLKYKTAVKRGQSQQSFTSVSNTRYRKQNRHLHS